MPVHALEPRRLFAFATFDDSFGTGGLTAIDAAVDADAHVTPLADGRLIVAGRSAVHYRRGDGNADGRRATGGTLALVGRVADVAVDPATGRAAVLRDLGRSGAERSFAVDLYDARGRLDATRTVASRANGTPVALAFDASTGGLVVATDRAIADGPGTVARRAVVWRLDAMLAVDEQFGDSGRTSLDWASGVDGSAGEWATFDQLLLDHAGRIHVVESSRTYYPENGTGRFFTYIHRLPADGGDAVGWSAGGRGTAEVRRDAIVPNGTPGTRDDVTANLGTVLLADGTLHFLQGRAGVELDNSEELDEFAYVKRQSIRTHGGGGSGWVEHGGIEPSADVRPGGVAFDAAGRLVVALLGEAGRSTTFRAIDPQIPGYRPPIVAMREALVPVESTSIAVDRDGRIVGTGVVSDFAGGLRLALFAIREGDTADAVSAEVPAGDATLGVDGVVRVRGTSADDLIVVRAEGVDLLVEINDDVRRFAMADVRAVAVAAGRGDDFVEVASSLPGVRALGEAGDDTLIGGGGDDTLSGGSGADRVEGRAGDDRLYGDAGADALIGGLGDDVLRGGDGNDHLEGDDGGDALYGEADKDVLLGGDGPDWIMGNTGNDRLYASGVVASVGVDDGAPDTLLGNNGLDFLRVDAGDDDFFTLDAGEDTLAHA